MVSKMYFRLTITEGGKSLVPFGIVGFCFAIKKLVNEVHLFHARAKIEFSDYIQQTPIPINNPNPVGAGLGLRRVENHK